MTTITAQTQQDVASRIVARQIAWLSDDGWWQSLDPFRRKLIATRLAYAALSELERDG